MDFLTLVFFVAGFIFVLYGASLLVKGASRLALAVGLSPLVIGLTIVAYGTSAPELAVSLQAALAHQDDISLGNIIGSNISNVFLVLGLAAAFRALSVSKQALRVDGPVMLGASALIYSLSLDGRIAQLEGVLLLICGIGYTWISIYISRKQQQQEAKKKEKHAGGGKLKNSLFVVAGLILLVAGANALVASSVDIATYLGLSNVVIGLTIIAVGTSLPEIATSFVAGLRGESDIAIGNAVGSNTMNIFIIAGLSSLITPGGLKVSDIVLSTDLPVMMGAAVLCLVVMYSGYSIHRWEGIFFLLFFAAYMAFVVIRNSNPEYTPQISALFYYAVLPITATTAGVSVLRTFRAATKKDA